MSLFQCDICGCVENTATSDGGYLISQLIDKERNKVIYLSYLKALGLKETDELGRYCSVCTPDWFDDRGEYGIGPNPEKKEWHDRFPRMFLPKGQFKTDNVGNLSHKITGDSDFKNYILYTEYCGVLLLSKEELNAISQLLVWYFEPKQWAPIDKIEQKVLHKLKEKLDHD